MITKKQLINEITSTMSDGRYYTKLRFGPKNWDKKQLGPFDTSANIFTNAELAHDEKDGELSVPEDEAIEIETKTREISQEIDSEEQIWPSRQMIDEEYEKIIIEDLRVWFGTKKKPKGSSQPKGPWVNICRKDKDGKHPPCGREKAESKGYPKCRAAGVASKMSDAEKRNACQQKRKAEKSNPKTGTGNKPTMVSHKKK